MNSNNDDEDVSQHRLRFADVAEEPRRMLPPIRGFEKMPLVPLEEAVKPLVKHLHDIGRYALMAKQKCKLPLADGLSIDESASIRLYTMEWKPRDQCLYFVLNKTLRSEDRSLLKDWFLYLKLIISSLLKIPSIPRVILRGVKLDLSQNHSKDDKVVWWAFSSCTDSMKVLENGPFFGKTGVRTLFKIDCYSGKDIRQHSAYSKENEILLLAATQFQIISNINAGDNIHIIHLKEIEPEYALIEKTAFANVSSSISIHQVQLMPPADNTTFSTKTVQPKTISLQLTTDLTYRNLNLEQHITRFHSHSYVNLNGQQLTDRDMPLVVQQIIIDKRCVNLSLQNNQITAQGILALALGIRDSTTLEELDLSHNHLRDEDLIPLIRELSMKRIANAEQWKCCGIAKLKELEKAPIKILNLSNNNIGDEGARYLAEMLKVKRTLIHLHLNDNRISDRGAQLLMNALCYSTTNLLKLYLHNNQFITDTSVDYLINMFKENRSLNTLWLINCNLTNAGRQRLKEASVSKKNFYLNIEMFD